MSLVVVTETPAHCGISPDVVPPRVEASRHHSRPPQGTAIMFR